MLMSVVKETPVFDNTNGYYNKLVESYTKHEGSYVLGWWLMEEYFYYSCRIEPFNNLKGGTPLIFIDRKKSHLIYDDEFLGKWTENTQKECVDRFPFAIHSIGCDDGSKGWLFKTKEEALSWFEEFESTINTFSEDFESGWEVLHYFQNNQYWLN